MDTIYIEAVFLDNALLDFLLLFCSCRLADTRIRFGPLAAGACIGGIYGSAALLLPWLAAWPCKLIGAALLCLPCGLRPAAAFFRRLLCFYCAAFVWCGAALALYYMAPGLSGRVPLRLLMFAAAIACVLSELLSRRGKVQPQLQYTLQLRLYGETLSLPARCDTGNGLTDLSGGGVIVADSAALTRQLSPAGARVLAAALAHPPRTFCCTTAAGPATLPAILPESLLLCQGSCCYTVKAYLALMQGGETALLPPHLRLSPAPSHLSEVSHVYPHQTTDP